MKKIIILNGSISDLPIIQKAKEMGYYVITTGNAPELPGHKYADEYIYADYSDKDLILRIARENKVEGIVSCANDFGVITASYVAEEMGWPGHDSYETSVMMHHKDKLRMYFSKMGFPVPQYDIFCSKKGAIEYCKSCEYPIMVKANDLTGGKGIKRANSFEEAVEAIDNSFEKSRDRHIVIESYIDGVQQSIVVFIANKTIIQTSSSNIYCIRNPYLVQAETYPAENFDLVKNKLYSMILTMVEDLNLVDGIFSFQYIVKDGVPYVIDMMRRNFGNETLLLADVMTGFPWEEAYIRASLGLDCSNIDKKSPQARFCGHFEVLSEKDGVLKDIQIDPSIERRLFKKTIGVRRGEKITNHISEVLEYLYYTYEDLEMMNREVPSYNDLIKIIVEEENSYERLEELIQNIEEN